MDATATEGSTATAVATPEHTGDKGPNLRDVIRIIPESCYDNPTWKGLWYVFRDALMYLAMVAALLSTDRLLYLIPLWAVSGLVLSALFVIGHDAGHKALFKNRRLCDLVGRITMLPTLHNYSSWILGHNRVHHGFTVHEERDFVWHPYSAEAYAKLSRWGKLMHRIEWSFLGAGIYYLIEIWWKKMMIYRAPDKIAGEIRKDQRFLYAGIAAGIATFTLFAVVAKDFSVMGTAGYTAWIAVKVMIIPWLAFNYIIGAVVYLHHINPDLQWHAHESWSRFKAQMEGTMIYRVSPRILNVFLHDIMIHVPHHVDARIPFYNLNQAAAHIRANYPDVVKDTVLRLSDYIRATRRCKLYDFSAEAWMDYKGRLANPQHG